MENIIRDLETITVNQMEIIKLKIIVYKIKLLLSSFNNKFEMEGTTNLKRD